MNTLLPEAVKIAICSAVLWGAYELLLGRRVQPRWCRLYLLLLPVLAVAIPRLRIPLLPAPVIEPGLAVFAEPIGTKALPAAAPLFPWAETVVGTLWLTGALVILGAIVRQLLVIGRLRRRAAVDRSGRFAIALTEERIAPFSFFRTIYLWAETPTEERATIVAHEASHIAHRHSGERLLMEGMKALLWWNPFVWIAARRLAEAQEYEADRDVLAQGCDPAQYMNTLFRQLFGYSPDIANGLRHSLTKKRFQMMTTHIGGRYALLRLAGTALAVTGLLCTFSLTTRAAVIRTTPGTSDTLVGSGRPEPLYIVNGEEKGSSKEAFDFARALTPPGKGIKLDLHKLLPDEAMEKYGEKGCHGAVEITIEHIDKAANTATTVPEVAVVRFSTQNSSPAAPTVSPTADDTAGTDPDEPWLIAQTMPKFQGGSLQDFRAWVQQRLRYPDTEAMGRVVVTFIIERDGSMGPVRVLQSPDEALANEAVRVIESVPAGLWTPGLQGGEAVRVKYTLPIDFRTITAPTAQPAQAE